ncbi:mitochondrial ribosomal protein subunit L20-domain-containing protein [Trichophaea hybrida]|nr:mitochondrial ribosomal protein subunit L20-domain-containing protein [Trichophaea hybrida]
MLRIHPHPSMILNANSPRTDHIVYNPPSSAPTPLITPTLFLPKDDPRRRLFAAAAAAPPKPANQLPPPLREPYEKSYHLTLADCKRMRSLRNTDPGRWHRTALAKEFNCSSLFVGMVCQASEERLAQMAFRAEKVKSRWGPKRTIAREDRQKRRAGWGGADGL